MKRITSKTKLKNGKVLTVRYPQKKDAPAMLRYINALSKEKTYIFFQGEQLTLDEEERYLNKQLGEIKSNRTIQLLAFLDGKLVGISKIALKNKAEKHIGNLGISVAKEYRGIGIGKILIKEVLDNTKKKLPELKIVTAKVFSNNSLAISMYEKLGFTQYGLLPNGILHKSKYIDTIYMYKSLQ